MRTKMHMDTFNLCNAYKRQLTFDFVPSDPNTRFLPEIYDHYLQCTVIYVYVILCLE